MLLMAARPSTWFSPPTTKSPFPFCLLPEVENFRAAIREISLPLSAGSRAPFTIKDFMLILKLVLLCLKRSFLLSLVFKVGGGGDFIGYLKFKKIVV